MLSSTQSEVEGKFLGMTPINVSKEDLQWLRDFMKSNKVTDCVKDIRMKRFVGGLCVLCADIPTKIAKYDYQGVTRIERYCDECAEKQFSRSRKETVL